LIYIPFPLLTLTSDVDFIDTCTLGQLMDLRDCLQQQKKSINVSVKIDVIRKFFLQMFPFPPLHHNLFHILTLKSYINVTYMMINFASSSKTALRIKKDCIWPISRSNLCFWVSMRLTQTNSNIPTIQKDKSYKS
jgi:hypothetical protein